MYIIIDSFGNENDKNCAKFSEPMANKECMNDSCVHYWYIHHVYAYTCISYFLIS